MRELGYSQAYYGVRYLSSRRMWRRWRRWRIYVRLARWSTHARFMQWGWYFPFKIANLWIGPRVYLEVRARDSLSAYHVPRGGEEPHADHVAECLDDQCVTILRD